MASALGGINGGIGDYIHLNEKNYFEHGINRFKTAKNQLGEYFSDAPGLSWALAENHKNLLNLINNKAGNINNVEMARVLTQYVYGINIPVNGKSAESSLDSDTRNALIGITTEAARAALLATKENTKTHQNAKWVDDKVITNALTRYSNAVVSTKEIKKTLNTASISKKRLEQTIQKLQESRKKIFQLMQQEAVSSQRIKDIVETYGPQLANLEQIEQELRAVLSSKEKTARSLKGENNALKNKLDTVYKLFETLGGEYLFDVQGPAFEAFLAALGEAGDSLVKGYENEVIKDLVNTTKNNNQTNIQKGQVWVSTVKATTTVSLSDYSNYDFSSSKDYIDENGNGFNFQINQNNLTNITTDVIFYKDHAPSDIAKAMGDMEQLNISAKNYGSATQHGGISVLDQTSLYNLLGLLNPSFANHYLNLVAAESSERISQLTLAVDELKFALLVRGLTGTRSFTGSNNTADCLILNDRLEQRVYVVNFKQLLNYYGKTIDTLSNLNTIATFSNVDILSGGS